MENNKLGNLKPLFSSISDNWRTPTSFYKRLDEEFHFDFDPCPSNSSFDGLHVEWGQRNFINPPYLRVSMWVKKGYFESLKGKLCVFLLASRTDTKWFHNYVLPYADEIRFIKGRLRFSNAKENAPFPSMIVVMGK